MTPIVETLYWRSEDDCAACAQRWAACGALDDALVALHGPLGAGKTTFVRYILRALGVTGRIKSPSYAIVEPYSFVRHGQSHAVWHCDFYRFAHVSEWEDAGLRDVFAAQGLKLVEWAQNARPLLPAPDLSLYIAVQAHGVRQVRVQASSPQRLAALQGQAC